MKTIYYCLTPQMLDDDGWRIVERVSGFIVIELTPDELSEIRTYGIYRPFEESFNEWAMETGAMDDFIPHPLIVKNSVRWRVLSRHNRSVCIALSNFNSDAEPLDKVRREDREEAELQRFDEQKQEGLL